MATGNALFGRIRKLLSGRWQARYRGPDGVDRPAPATFATVTDARVWLSTVEVDPVRGKWIRPDLSKRTREKYAGLLKVRWSEQPLSRPLEATASEAGGEVSAPFS